MEESIGEYFFKIWRLEVSAKKQKTLEAIRKKKDRFACEKS